MIRTLAGFLLLALTSAQNAAYEVAQNPNADTAPCFADERLAMNLAADPTLKGRMDAYEEKTRRYVAGRRHFKKKAGEDYLAVVVHVLYNKASENISEDRIKDQMVEVNNNMGIDPNRPTNSLWTSVQADTGLRFQLVEINRVFTTITSFSGNDAMKTVPGAEAWDSSRYLNFWICNLGGGLVGYAQFPGGSSSTDGIVMGGQYVGGRTFQPSTTGFVTVTTHEIGHWINLRHIWGDGRCKRDDFCDDTPSSDGPNRDCPVHTSCQSRDMVENYMDYTDDTCQTLFTADQVARAEATFAVGGRSDFVFLSSTCTQGGCAWCHSDSPGTCLVCSSDDDELISGQCISPVTCNDANCATCTAPDSCTICADGYGVVAGSCSQCGTNCNDCDASTCTDCAVGSYANGLNCVSCPANCDSCSSSGCDANGCATGFYNNGGSCSQCGANCNSCDSAGCLSCNAGFTSDGQGGCVEETCGTCYADCKNEACCSGYLCYGTRGNGCPARNVCLRPGATYCNTGCVDFEGAFSYDGPTTGGGNNRNNGYGVTVAVAGAAFATGIIVSSLVRRRKIPQESRLDQSASVVAVHEVMEIPELEN